ncbi:unnamed protein product [Linum trigynum]|uniref:Uncharacterized protein n=1 Tax=Linum trigynum TaxID=586398 RepID=A0AAV2CH14_9ROSI
MYLVTPREALPMQRLSLLRPHSDIRLYLLFMHMRSLLFYFDKPEAPQPPTKNFIQHKTHLSPPELVVARDSREYDPYLQAR